VKKAIMIVALLATISTASASAHGRWYSTAAKTAQDIEWKYTAVVAAKCSPLPTWARRQYGADSQISGTTRQWNHFFCAVYSRYSESACVVVAHLVGQNRNGINLTSWPGRGCTTRQLWG
jgi:hypothetical protein